jgi:hypothetical protein
MALNGLLEAFVSALGSTSTLKIQSLWMIVCAGVFWSVGGVCLRWGALGIVGANCVSVGVRAGFGFWFVWSFFEERMALRQQTMRLVAEKKNKNSPLEDGAADTKILGSLALWDLVPKDVRLWCVVIVSALVARASEGLFMTEDGFGGERWLGFLVHVGVGSLCLGACLGAM